MAVSRVKTWQAAETLTADDLNAEFTNLTDNGTDVAFPLTKNVDAAGYLIQNAALDTPDQLHANIVSLDKYADLAAAVTAIGGSAEATVLIPSNSNVTDNLTVSSNITLWFAGAGKLTVSVGKTLTVNGPVVAPVRQIFAGTGTTTISSTTNLTIYPQWTGSTGPPRLTLEVIATASLPAASASMNGTILIEDGGSGDRNVIVYAGGQRFRIDGGANV